MDRLLELPELNDELALDGPAFESEPISLLDPSVGDEKLPEGVNEPDGYGPEPFDEYDPKPVLIFTNPRMNPVKNHSLSDY